MSHERSAIAFRDRAADAILTEILEGKGLTYGLVEGIELLSCGASTRIASAARTSEGGGVE